MKRTFHRMAGAFALCAIPLLILCSCGKDVPKDPVDMGGGITFSVSTDNASTKTAFSGQGGTNQQTGSLASERIDWVDGDLITIVSPQAKVKVGNQLVYSSDNPQYSTADYSVKNPSTEGETVSRATIEPVSGSGLRWGEGEHNFFALYPSAGSAAYTTAEKAKVGITPTGFTGTIPTAQTPQWAGNTGSAQMQYAYMTAPASANANAAPVDLAFTPQFTAFEFTVGAGEFPSVALTSFTLEALDADAAVTGDFTYAFADDAVTTGSSSNKITVDLTGKSVTSASGSTTAKTLTFTVLGLPVDMGAMRMTFEGAEIGKRTLTLKNTGGDNINFRARKKYRISGIRFPITAGGEPIIWDQEDFGEDILWDDGYVLEVNSTKQLTTPYTGGTITLATGFRSCLDDVTSLQPEPFEFQTSADGVNWTDGLPDWLSAPGVDMSGSTTATTISLTASPMTKEAPLRSVYLRLFQPSSGNTSASWQITQEKSDFATPLTIEPFVAAAVITISNPDNATITWSIDGVEQSSANSNLSFVVEMGKSVELFQEDRTKSIGTIGLSTACYVYGNVMSLVAGTDFMSQTELGCDGQFQRLFYESLYSNSDGGTNKLREKLHNHPYRDIELPATTLTANCYREMFMGRSFLTRAPALPAEIMADYCYYGMFHECINLKPLPADYLPATTLAANCYGYMFASCRALTRAPDLPATTLAESCYEYMFYWCGSLTTAPELPAETLATACYRSMFYRCSSLATAPALPATTLAESCYEGMFGDCGLLATAPELPAETLTTACYRNMFAYCKALTQAPALPATTLAESCYEGMFGYYTAVTTAPELPAETLAPACYRNMFTSSKLTTAPELPATTLAESCYEGMFSSCYSLNTAPALLPAETLATACYRDMFTYCKLTTAPALPATTLAESCYEGMFKYCSSLTTAPELPATNLTTNCYAAMFSGCTSLTATPALPATVLTENCYVAMFSGCTSLTTAPALSATVLTNSCYSAMFSGCTSLTTAPAELPATILTENCYASMFSGCSSLTQAPVLPATTLERTCYRYMFSGCTSLTTAPALPATTLASYCYERMFSGCTSLTTAPELPATTLAYACYQSMFYGCTSLTTAPVLPATTLIEYCYNGMFSGCSSLKYVECHAASHPGAYYSHTYGWMSGVAGTGTFKMKTGVNWPQGANGIPNGWGRAYLQ